MELTLYMLIAMRYTFPRPMHGRNFYLGWTLNELERLSEYSETPMPPDKLLDAKSEFSRALMLDPTNAYIKEYLEKVKKP